MKAQTTDRHGRTRRHTDMRAFTPTIQDSRTFPALSVLLAAPTPRIDLTPGAATALNDEMRAVRNRVLYGLSRIRAIASRSLPARASGTRRWPRPTPRVMSGLLSPWKSEPPVLRRPKRAASR